MEKKHKILSERRNRNVGVKIVLIFAILILIILTIISAAVIPRANRLCEKYNELLDVIWVMVQNLHRDEIAKKKITLYSIDGPGHQEIVDGWRIIQKQLKVEEDRSTNMLHVLIDANNITVLQFGCYNFKYGNKIIGEHIVSLLCETKDGEFVIPSDIMQGQASNFASVVDYEASMYKETFK